MDKRFIIGVAYNLLVDDEPHDSNNDSTNGEDQGSEVPLLQVRASTGNDKHALYHHKAIRLPRSEMLRENGDHHWRDKPLLVNHRGPVVGRINSVRIVDHNLEVSAEVTDPATMKRVDNGELGSFSVGYNAIEDSDGNKRYHIDELSLCHQPFFEGCAISVCASKDGTTDGDDAGGGGGGAIDNSNDNCLLEERTARKDEKQNSFSDNIHKEDNHENKKNSDEKKKKTQENPHDKKDKTNDIEHEKIKKEKPSRAYQALRERLSEETIKGLQSIMNQRKGCISFPPCVL